MYRASTRKGHRAGGDVGIGRSGQRQEQTHSGVHVAYWTSAEREALFISRLSVIESDRNDGMAWTSRLIRLLSNCISQLGIFSTFF